MTAFTPDWKLTINAVEYTNVAISDIAHQAGREDIYSQPVGIALSYVDREEHLRNCIGNSPK
jgi:hypothetical protein